MQVAQRGTSHTYSNSESGYDSIDRIFSAAFVTGGSLTISQQTANYSGVDAEYFLRATPSGSVSAGSATIYSEYRVEDVISVSNKTFTLSFDAKAASDLTFQFRRRQYYGSGGSTEEYSSFSDISVTTSWQRKTITFTIPDLSGKTIGSGSFLSLFFYWSTSQGSDNLNDAAIDITNLQLEVGEQATPFEHRSYDDELYRCQRYFIKAENIANTDYLLTLQAYATTGIYGTIAQFPRFMRTTPSVGQGGNFGAYRGSSADAGQPDTIVSLQSSDIGWKTGGWSGGSGFTVGDASVTYWENGAYLTADAEL